MTEPRRIVVKNIPQPDCWLDVPSVPLTDATLKKRKSRVLARMAQLSLETLIVYADKEHGANFEYLTGFIPRFERRCWCSIRMAKRCWCWVMKTSSWRPMPGWKTA